MPDTIVLPDYPICQTARFGDNKYSISDEGELLYIELIQYPYKGKWMCEVIFIVPLGVVKGI